MNDNPNLEKDAADKKEARTADTMNTIKERRSFKSKLDALKYLTEYTHTIKHTEGGSVSSRNSCR